MDLCNEHFLVPFLKLYIALCSAHWAMYGAHRLLCSSASYPVCGDNSHSCLLCSQNTSGPLAVGAVCLSSHPSEGLQAGPSERLRSTFRVDAVTHVFMVTHFFKIHRFWKETVL